MSLAAAVRIGRLLADRALWHEDRCTWIGPGPRSVDDSSLSVHHTIGPNLYDGTSGIAWFLGHLYSSSGDERFRRTSLGAIRQSLAGAQRLARELRFALYSGAIGIFFAAAELGRRLDAEDIEREAVVCLRAALSRESPGSSPDLLSGTAGTLAILPILSARFADERLLDFAMELGDCTLQRAQRSEKGLSWRSSRSQRYPNLTGFAHGAAGIGHGLLELFAATGFDRYREGAEGAFEYERAWFDCERENWPDLRSVPAKSRSKSRVEFLTNWCHGAPGIALSRARAWELLRDERYRAEARAALRTTRAVLTSSLESERGDFSLCHGLAGIAEIVHETSHVLDPVDRPRAARAVRAGAKDSEARTRSWHTESPTLFLGLAGVGYLNLRLHDPRAPSLLMLRRQSFL